MFLVFVSIVYFFRKFMNYLQQLIQKYRVNIVEFIIYYYINGQMSESDQT